MIEELGEEEALTLLQNNRFGHLGCALNDEPYVVPVNYWCEDRFAYLHTLPGRKLDIMRANPVVCLQVETIIDPYHWRSVIANGIFEEVTNATEREHVLAELFKRMPHLTPVESRMSHGLDQTIVFRVRITNATGVYEDWR